MKTIEVPSSVIAETPREQWASYCLTRVGGTDDVYVSDGNDLLEMYNDCIEREKIDPPVPSSQFDWQATFDNYDGAPDSPTRHQVGHGATEQEAIDNLHSIVGTTLLDVLNWHTKDGSGNSQEILTIKDGQIVTVRIKS